MQTFEIRHLRLVAGFRERLETRLHQRRHTAAQHRLFAEQIGLRLLGERGLDHAGTCAADRAGIRQRVGACMSRRIDMHRDQPRHAAAFLIELAHAMPR